MPTIRLELSSNQKRPADRREAASVASSPGRLYYATVGGKARTFERVGTAANGDEIYRDQTR